MIHKLYLLIKNSKRSFTLICTKNILFKFIVAKSTKFLFFSNLKLQDKKVIKQSSEEHLNRKIFLAKTIPNIHKHKKYNII